jgi:hypothetical protein
MQPRSQDELSLSDSNEFFLSHSMFSDVRANFSSFNTGLLLQPLCLLRKERQERLFMTFNDRQIVTRRQLLKTSGMLANAAAFQSLLPGGLFAQNGAPTGAPDA